MQAEDDEKAPEVYQRELSEAILLHWKMPVIDHSEFLGNPRRMPGGDQPRVVFRTTENYVAHIARAARPGTSLWPDCICGGRYSRLRIGVRVTARSGDIHLTSSRSSSRGRP